MNKEILQSLQEYFSFLGTYQEKRNMDLVMTCDKGYWWCTSDKFLQKNEVLFLQTAKNKELLLSMLTEHKRGKDLPNVISLLGWSKDHEWSGELLEKYVSKSNYRTTNAALRALFPKVVTGKYVLHKRTIHTALYSRSLDVKNKILGMLAFTPSDTVLLHLSVSDRRYIRSLLQHRDKARIAILARRVVDRLKDEF